MKQRPHSRSGNVQGFELPRGCLMTSGLILLPILTLAIGLVHANSRNDVMLTVLTSATLIAGFVFMRNFAPRVIRPRRNG
ncbi:hypothetical protein QTO30_10970 [Yoonia sp. GPGPB17]|uniref:hypothetical protein n=1 Tax=Yoonia sp. GPGPB17 TaxID=3026147 RepID=UPI0030BD7F32